MTRAPTTLALALLVLVALAPARADARDSPGWSSVSANGRSTCALDTDQHLWCWGANDFGQLGDGTRTDHLTPTRIGTATWRTVTTNALLGHESIRTCGVRTGGSLWCWGADFLGNGSTQPRLQPTRVGTSSSWLTVSSGSEHTCAVQSGGSLWCWGSSSWNAVGNGTGQFNTYSPVRIGTGSTWQSVTTGPTHTCATQQSGSLWCWGNDDHGQLGTGSAAVTGRPQRVGTAKGWVDVAAGGFATCGTKTAGQLLCWGSNGSGQLGLGDGGNRQTPQLVRKHLTLGTVSVGAFQTCAVRADHGLSCWGGNEDGQLGLGDTAPRMVPRPVGTELTWASVSAGVDDTCAVQTDHSLLCWGDNTDGDLGDGTVTDRHVPTRIGPPAGGSLPG